MHKYLFLSVAVGHYVTLQIPAIRIIKGPDMVHCDMHGVHHNSM